MSNSHQNSTAVTDFLNQPQPASQRNKHFLPSSWGLIRHPQYPFMLGIRTLRSKRSTQTSANGNPWTSAASISHPEPNNCDRDSTALCIINYSTLTTTTSRHSKHKRIEIRSARMRIFNQIYLPHYPNRCQSTFRIANFFFLSSSTRPTLQFPSIHEAMLWFSRELMSILNDRWK